MTVLRQKEPRRRAIILHSDIAERKQTEEALRRSEGWFRLLTDSLPVLISYVDENQSYRFNNKGYELWFCHSREFVEGKRLRQILGTKAYEAIRPRVEAALSGELVSFEDFVPYRGAGRRYVQVTYVPDRQAGRVLGFFALIQDLTERKRVEEELTAREEEFRSMFELAAVGNAQADPQAGRFLRVNKKFCDLTGYAEAELLDMTYNDITYPEDRVREAAEIEKVVKRERPMWSIEKRCVRKDGRIIWVAVNGTAMGHDRKMLCMMANVVDITERKSYEELLHAHREALRNLAAEISQTQEKERRQIADDLHDHLGQNLVLAKMKLGELKALLDGPHTAAIEQRRALVDQSIQDTRSLVRDLSPQVLYELGLEVALDWLVEHIQVKYGLCCSAEVAPLRHTLREEIRVILFQAARELLVNVAKHARAQQAKVILKEDGGRVALQVLDDGRGFDPSSLTLPSSTVRGFGLFSIRERVALLGGDLDIDSNPERGTRVTVTIPA